jgi:hypothetical protein
MSANMSKFLRGSLGAAVVIATNLTAVAPAVADINIGALDCQAPYLDQAEGLRWHEHYVINPENGVTTWVVCPIAFETNDLPNQFQIGAFGNTVPGANGLNACYANIIDLRNQHIPTNNFLNNPGQRMTFQTIMNTQNPSNTLWSSWVTLTQGQINGGHMPPPSTPVDPTQSQGPAFWTITINCQLKAGQALNMVSLWPTL